MLGGAPEVEARAAALGGDETGRCAAITKDTKNQGALTRPGEQSVQAQRAKPSTATENGEQSAPTGRQAKPLHKAAATAKAKPPNL